MILIIPLRNSGNFENLRYALRSICLHMPITDCILVGGKPKWYKGFHLEHKDYGIERKEENIRDKVIAGSELLGGEFIFANDDHILNAPITKIFNKGLLSENLATRNPNGSYARLLTNTINRYGDVANVDTHCPMIMNSEGVKLTKFDWPKFGIGFKTCYAQENGIVSEYMPDCKVSVIPENREWYSLTPGFRVKTLKNIFPEPCIFEK